MSRGNVSFVNSAVAGTLGGGGGSIFVNARNLDLTSSTIGAGILKGFGSVDAQAGDIKIDATDSVTLKGGLILSKVNDGAIGNGGAVDITYC